VAAEYLKHGQALPLLPNSARVQQIAADGFNALLARCDSDVPAGLKILNTRVDAELARQRVLDRKP